VAKIAQLGQGEFCQTPAMTTKTIPEYLEDERQKNWDAQLRIEEEAARIQPMHHGRHCTAKQPVRELPSVVKAATRARKTATQAPKKSRTARKSATKVRNAA
jgi:hypothetical protein